MGLAGAANPALAGVIVSYPLTTAGSTAPSFVDPGVTTAFDSSNLALIVVGNDGFGVVLQAYQQSGATSASGALASNNFFTISVTANPGSLLNLSDLTFDAGPGGNRSAPNTGFFVRSSADGFATDLFSETYPAGNQSAPATQSVSLSGPPFQDLSSVTFRFYTFTAFTGFSQSDDFRNIQVSGSVVSTGVPEPSSLALFGLGTLSLLGCGWRKRKQAKA
jgi:hypothetical protein